jgi:hypothetical protein
MSNLSDFADLDRLRELLRRREAQAAAGRAIPEDAAERIARVLAGAEPEPAACEAIQTQLPEYVGVELRGGAVARLFPERHRHLLTCQACSTLHADLLELELGPDLAPLPAPDLAALRWPVAGEPLRQLVARQASQLLARLAVPPAGFDELVETFFELVDELGERVSWSPATARAFGLAGDEASAAARCLLATWQASLAVRDGLAARPGIAARKADFERLLHESARGAARRNGLGRDEARRFTVAFVELALAPDADMGGTEDAGSELPG